MPSMTECGVCKSPEVAYFCRGTHLTSQPTALCSTHRHHLNTCCKSIRWMGSSGKVSDIPKAGPSVDLANTCFICKSKFVFYNCTKVNAKLCVIHAHDEGLRELGPDYSCCKRIKKGDAVEEKSYCTMCESEFTEMSTTHRYQTCPYYNGCKKCGSSIATASHVKTCGGFSGIKCSMCLEKYTTSQNEHRKECYFYKGCPICKTSYFSPGHVQKCREQALVMSEIEDMQFRCDICNKFVKSDIYQDHVNVCIRRETTVSTAVAAVSMRALESKKEPDGPSSWCFCCGDDIPDDLFEKHVDLCKKRVSERFKRTGHTHGPTGPIVIDDRPMPVLPGERVVKFIEDHES